MRDRDRSDDLRQKLRHIPTTIYLLMLLMSIHSILILRPAHILRMITTLTRSRAGGLLLAEWRVAVIDEWWVGQESVARAVDARIHAFLCVLFMTSRIKLGISAALF